MQWAAYIVGGAVAGFFLIRWVTARLAQAEQDRATAAGLKAKENAEVRASASEKVIEDAGKNSTSDGPGDWR